MTNSNQSFRPVIVVWTLVCFLIGSWSLWLAKPETQRSVYSDLSTHVMIADSVWHDLDLKYSLEDLARFRQEFPAESGPIGLYLKKVSSGELIYAKPYLYGAMAAVFYGWLGIDGFIVLNSICLLVIGLVSTLSLRTALGTTWGLVVVVAFILPSPFLAWVAVPHPDLFIAALLAGSGYLMLRAAPSPPWVPLVGAAVLAAALHDKPVFVVLLPFLLLAMPRPRSVKRLVSVVGILTLSWLVLNLPNLLGDGTLFSYQGARFYIVGPPFPLEDGWVLPATDGITGHVFRPELIATSLLENLALLPTKLVDFFVGRQTGILVYFPVALFVLIFGMFGGLGRGLWLFAGFFAYLVLNWLAFPTNGYGGAGSYGPRYMMQVLPIIPLAYLSFYGNLKRGISLPWKLTFIAAGVSAMAIHYRAFVLNDGLVRRNSHWFLDHPLKRFPVEEWLLPTTTSNIPRIYERSSDGNEILVNKTLLDGEAITLGLGPSNIERRILFQFGEFRAASSLELWSRHDSEVMITSSGGNLGQIRLFGWQPVILNLDHLKYDRVAFDLLIKNFVRIAKIEALLNEDTIEGAGLIIRFAREHQVFSNYGHYLRVGELNSSGVSLLHGWNSIEPWGVWTDGSFAHIGLYADEDTRSYEVIFRLQGYVPKEDPVRKARLWVNNRLLGDLQFTNGEEPKYVHFRFEINPDEEYINFGFEIQNPISPKFITRSPDSLLIGIGLSGFMINRIKDHEK